MQAASKKPALPSDDKRWRMVVATMRRLGHEPSALIETLHTVQESFGYLDDAALRFVAESLHVPYSRVYGVATFYNHFLLKPSGEHHCIVCLGTACYIRGGQQVLEAAEQAANIKVGQTTPDKKVSLLLARCIGMCWLSPVALYDGELVEKITPEDAAAKVQEWLNDVSA